MKKSLILLLLFFAQFAIGQIAADYSAIDKKAAAIPDDQAATTTGIANYINSNFETEDEKIRAVFYWITSTISYDVSKMYKPDSISSSQEKISNALKTRKGVCVHYALIFNDIANKLGIKTYIIPGYTNYMGELATIPHAWCASKIGGKWFVFDPTWAAGFIEGKKFTRKLNNAFYKAEPARMIASHMPFDYLWQFLNSPVNNQEFMSGNMGSPKLKIHFDYQSEIKEYEKLTEADKAFECAARVKENGLSNDMVIDFHNLKKKEFTILNQNKSVEKLIDITANFNEAIRDLNAFIMFRNKKFKPAQSDEALKKMIQDLKGKMNKCRDDVYNVGSVSAENTASLNSLKTSILKAIDKTKEQDDFVKEYLGKNALGRKLMFTNLR
jgi:hypothetical protein